MDLWPVVRVLAGSSSYSRELVLWLGRVLSPPRVNPWAQHLIFRGVRFNIRCPALLLGKTRKSYEVVVVSVSCSSTLLDLCLCFEQTKSSPAETLLWRRFAFSSPVAPPLRISTRLFRSSPRYSDRWSLEWGGSWYGLSSCKTSTFWSILSWEVRHDYIISPPPFPTPSLILEIDYIQDSFPECDATSQQAQHNAEECTKKQPPLRERKRKKLTLFD